MSEFNPSQLQGIGETSRATVQAEPELDAFAPIFSGLLGRNGVFVSAERIESEIHSVNTLEEATQALLLVRANGEYTKLMGLQPDG